MTTLRELAGMKDARGPQGIMARGANVYGGGSMAAQKGGGQQFGRPPIGGMGGVSGMTSRLGGGGGGSMGNIQGLLQRLGLLNPQQRNLGGNVGGADPTQFQPFKGGDAPGGGPSAPSPVGTQTPMPSKGAIQRRRSGGK